MKKKEYKILVTGGPVAGRLDAVKIITNEFRGGRMAALAERLACQRNVKVTYLAHKHSSLPSWSERLCLCHHNGFEDYMAKVLELAPQYDAVVLGAAVCNLIPSNPWEGKFPSHNYKPGDKISIDFEIAPRIIDKVKESAPKTQLFGFKLLANVDHNELIDAAYGVLVESRAICVFANTRGELYKKYAVMKDLSVHELNESNYHEWILDLLDDDYYHSVVVRNEQSIFKQNPLSRVVLEETEPVANKLVLRYSDKFKESHGFMFGTIAVRSSVHGSFITTKRLKRKEGGVWKWDWVVVKSVDNIKKGVYVYKEKATLNASLLNRIFELNNDVKAIIHYHCNEYPGLVVLPYAPPGTARDVTGRNPEDLRHDFAIEGHGVYKLLTSEDLRKNYE